MEKGIDAPEIIHDTFYEKTYNQNQILGRALLESILLLDGQCIATYVRQKEMEFYGVKPERSGRNRKSVAQYKRYKSCDFHV